MCKKKKSQPNNTLCLQPGHPPYLCPDGLGLYDIQKEKKRKRTWRDGSRCEKDFSKPAFTCFFFPKITVCLGSCGSNKVQIGHCERLAKPYFNLTSLLRVWEPLYKENECIWMLSKRTAFLNQAYTVLKYHAVILSNFLTGSQIISIDAQSIPLRTVPKHPPPRKNSSLKKNTTPVQLCLWVDWTVYIDTIVFMSFGFL